jgi:chromosome partitioning protein
VKGGNNMAKIISVFNHKGGVGKTTTVFHISWLLAEMGKRVLIIDADSQCNLTGYILGLNDFDRFYEANPKQNLMSAVKQAFDATPIPIHAIESVPVKGREGLFLIPGHIDISLFEVPLGMAHDLSTSISTFRNLPGSFYEFISRQVEKDKIDIVLIDMNPSLSSINQNLFCISDGFIIPAAPDYFSRMAIRTLSQTLPKWVKWSRNAIDTFRDSTYIWPDKTPIFLGTIIQNFSRRKGLPSSAFRTLIDEFYADVDNILLPALASQNMLKSDVDLFKGLIPNFQGLVARIVDSGNPAVPVFYADTLSTGIIDENYAKNKSEYKAAYEKICNGIIKGIL